jgi:ParB family chromosome partitioning protein
MTESVLMTQQNEQVVELRLELLVRGLFQPRELFDPALMESTRKSIEEKGQVHPLIVRPIKLGNPLFNQSWTEIHYEIADGERRVRCLRDLGRKTAKAIIRDLSDLEMLDYGVTTNDSVPLNPIERAKVFYRLAKEFNQTQEQIAKSYNMKQQQVSEFIRLLELPESLQDLTARAVISVRHAREILKISDNETRSKLAKEIVEHGLSTRRLNQLTKQIKAGQGIDPKADHKITHEDIIFEGIGIIGEDFSKEIDETRQNLEEKSVVSSIFEPGKASVPQSGPLWLLPILDVLGQFNAIFVAGKAGHWIQAYLKTNPKLAHIRPEHYLAWFEISLLLPTIAMFFLFKYSPFIAMALGAVALAVIFLKIFEEQAPHP